MSKDVSIKKKVGQALKDQTKLWNSRYGEEGVLWGEKPSETVVLLIAALKDLRDNVFRAKDILTVGAGYGRDEIYLAANTGVNITAYEPAKKGVALGKKLAKKNGIADDRIIWKSQDFSTNRSQKKFDALMSHRTLHLLDDKQVKGFVKRAASSVKDGGAIVVSARNFEDFDETQMRWISKDDGIAEYTLPGRQGHILRFWNEAKFKDHFSQDFEVTTFHSSSEEESKDNDKRTAITIMVAYKKVAEIKSSKPVRRASDNITRRTSAAVAAVSMAFSPRAAIA